TSNYLQLPSRRSRSNPWIKSMDQIHGSTPCFASPGGDGEAARPSSAHCREKCGGAQSCQRASNPIDIQVRSASTLDSCSAARKPPFNHLVSNTSTRTRKRQQRML